MTHRLLGLSVFGLSLVLASSAGAKWAIMFVPDEATGVSVSIDGEHVLDWKSAEGQAVRDVPAKFANLEKIQVRAEGNPTNRTAHVKVYWDGDEECDMKFDDKEECTAAR